MQEVDINNLVEINRDGYKILNGNIQKEIIIVGKIDKLFIRHIYDELDLSKVNCNEIWYRIQEDESIKNHILPNSLKRLDCYGNGLTSLPNLPKSLNGLFCHYNKLKILPELPNSLKYLYCDNDQLISLPNLPSSLEILCCSYNKLTSLPNLPNSLRKLICSNNKLTSLPKLPDSLEILNFRNNKLTSLSNLPNSLQELRCQNNQLTSLPDFSHFDQKINLGFNQDSPISYIPYNKNIELDDYSSDNKINIEGYPHNPITNQNELNKYMDYIKNYELNRIKSARK